MKLKLSSLLLRPTMSVDIVDRYLTLFCRPTCRPVCQEEEEGGCRHW